MKPIIIFWRSEVLNLDSRYTEATNPLLDSVHDPAKVLVILEELDLPYQ